MVYKYILDNIIKYTIIHQRHAHIMVGDAAYYIIRFTTVGKENK